MIQREGRNGARRVNSHRFLPAACVLILLAGAAAAQTPALSKQPPGFGDFTQRVQQYMKLRNALPNQRTTKIPAKIVDRRQSLAEAIREKQVTFVVERPELLGGEAHRRSSSACGADHGTARRPHPDRLGPLVTASYAIVECPGRGDNNRRLPPV